MGAITGVIISILVARWSYQILYVSKFNFWGRVEFQNFYDCDYPVFDTFKQVTIWKRTFKWRILLEIEPLVFEPKPTHFQKTFYLQIVDCFDELFLKAVPALNRSYGEIKESIVQYRKQVQPLLILVPLSEDKEWRIYCASDENLAFILYFKGFDFVKAAKFDIEKMKREEDVGH
ncbi:MAG: hypothetical protein JNL70_01915 [Saprospiraceae bacterium]|nr:hypothetical protein [Saprospiraceae bacterium]